jgi:hypothetical protein
VAAADVDGTSVRSLGGGTAPPVSLSMHGVEVEGYGKCILISVCAI